MEIYKCSNKIIKNWQWRHPGLVNLTDIILNLIDAKGGMALDVGCGSGRTSILLAKRGFKVDAFDIEPKVIDIAKELARKAQVDINFSVVDFTQKADFYQREIYDLIICAEVLEHVGNYRTIINNIYNCLKKGGIFIVTVPHDPKQYSILDSHGGHLRRFTIPQLKELLKEFHIVDCFTIGFPFMRMMAWLRILILNILKKGPSPEREWNNILFTKIISFLAYKLTKIDNFFNRLNKGTNIICKVKK